MLALIAGAAVIAGAAALVLTLKPRQPPPAVTAGTEAAPAPAAYVGGAACGGCHAAPAAAWKGSHHDRAMQEVAEQTVLGDFDDSEFHYGGITSRFFRRDGRFMVRTDGPDGKLADFEVNYTFGVTPLQQYLINVSCEACHGPGSRHVEWAKQAKPPYARKLAEVLPDDPGLKRLLAELEGGK